MTFKFIFDDRRFKVPLARFNKNLQRFVASQRLKGAVDIIFINDRQMTKLNSQFKGKNRPTDVLAFNLADETGTKYIEGEIYVDLQIAKRQARQYGSDYYEEIYRLCLHGLLHLLGYDDHDAKDKAKMWDIQESIIKGIFNGNE